MNKIHKHTRTAARSHRSARARTDQKHCGTSVHTRMPFGKRVARRSTRAGTRAHNNDDDDEQRRRVASRDRARQANCARAHNRRYDANVQHACATHAQVYMTRVCVCLCCVYSCMCECECLHNVARVCGLEQLTARCVCVRFVGICWRNFWNTARRTAAVILKIAG